MVLSVVDFPAPLCPKNAMMLPGASSNDTSVMTILFRYPAVSLRTSSVIAGPRFYAAAPK